MEHIFSWQISCQLNQQKAESDENTHAKKAGQQEDMQQKHITIKIINQIKETWMPKF